MTCTILSEMYGNGRLIFGIIMKKEKQRRHSVLKKVAAICVTTLIAIGIGVQPDPKIQKTAHRGIWGSDVQKISFKILFLICVK